MSVGRDPPTCGAEASAAAITSRGTKKQTCRSKNVAAAPRPGKVREGLAQGLAASPV